MVQRNSVESSKLLQCTMFGCWSSWDAREVWWCACWRELASLKRAMNWGWLCGTVFMVLQWIALSSFSKSCCSRYYKLKQLRILQHLQTFSSEQNIASLLESGSLIATGSRSLLSSLSFLEVCPRQACSATSPSRVRVWWMLFLGQSILCLLMMADVMHL